MASNNENNFSGEVGQKAVIEKDGKVLLVRPPGSDTWDLPGGRLHNSEIPAEGLKREIHEEIGADVEVGDAFFADIWIQTWKNPPVGRYFVAFKCTLLNQDAEFVLQEEEVGELRWISKEEMPAMQLYDICKKALAVYFKISDK